jgi:hypothetical protein
MDAATDAVGKLDIFFTNSQYRLQIRNKAILKCFSIRQKTDVREPTNCSPTDDGSVEELEEKF